MLEKRDIGEIGTTKMKKLLFIMDTFPVGGIAKSLLSLFNEIEGKYQIDFLIMEQEGLLIPLIPKSINILPEQLEREFRDPHPKRVFKNLKTLGFRRWVKWVGYSLSCCWARLTGGLHKHICAMDTYIGKHTKKIDKHYDAAIAYAGGRCIYYLVENVDADVKIGYVHSDYLVNETDFMLYKADRKYYPYLDHIVTISQKCVDSLKQKFPDLADRCCVVENICSVKTIRNMAARGEGYMDGFDGFRISSLVRFDIYTKGLDLAVAATKILKDKGKNFRWYILGDGEQRPSLEELIVENGISEYFILLGAKVNPYAYLKDSDIYVQTSRIEGKSVSLDEAKALAKPVVVTCFPSVFDQFEDGKTALIAEMTAEDVANKIEQLMEDEQLRNCLSKNLQAEKVGNEEQAQIFESLLETY